MVKVVGMSRIYDQIKTSSELKDEGISSSEISRRCRRGLLYKIATNAYTPVQTWQSWDGRHRFMAQHVAFMKTHPQYVLSHSSAALWWGAPLLEAPAKMWVSSASSAVRSKPGVHVSRSRKEICDQAVLNQGLAVTTPLQTILDCCQSLPFLSALCVADYFLHHRLVPVAELRSALLKSSGRYSKQHQKIAEYMSEKSESPAETVARYLVMSWGLSRPEEQKVIWVGRRYYRPDFLWEDAKVILEVDGDVKYSGAYGQPDHVLQKEVIRQRDLELRGYRFVRVRWSDLMNNPELVRKNLVDKGVR